MRSRQDRDSVQEQETHFMAINATRHTAGDGRNMEGICPLSPLDDVGLEIATESGSLANHAAAAALWEQPHSPVHPDVAVPEAFIAANTSSDGTSVGQRAESEFLAACLVPSGAEAQSAAGVYSLERLHAEVGFEDASDEKRETRLVSQAGKESSGQLKGGASKDESRSTREEKTVLECDADSGDDFVESEGAIDIEKIPEGHILRRYGATRLCGVVSPLHRKASVFPEERKPTDGEERGIMWSRARACTDCAFLRTDLVGRRGGWREK